MYIVGRLTQTSRPPLEEEVTLLPKEPKKDFTPSEKRKKPLLVAKDGLFP
jgi:hypothetical protein